jgi:CheY-like chemotaxis protein
VRARDPEKKRHESSMDIVTILRDLWRMRLLVVCVAALALLAGLAVAFKPGLPPQSRRHDVGVATLSVLVDTPRSQLIEVAPAGSDTLGLRASLIANLMVDGTVKDTIARRAGLEPNKLTGVAPSSPDQPSTTKPDPNGYTLTTTVQPNPDGQQLPIIQVEARAPDPDRAAALANASVAGLRDYLNTRAASERVPDARRLRVTGLGDAQASDAVRGPSSVMPLIAAIFVFLAGCGAILAFQGLVRGWRAESANDGPRRGGAAGNVPPPSGNGTPARPVQVPEVSVHAGGRRQRR